MRGPDKKKRKRKISKQRQFVCERCGSSAIARSPKRRFCSYTCAWESRYFGDRERTRKKRMPGEIWKCGLCGAAVKKRASVARESAFCNTEHMVLYMKKSAYRFNCVVCGKEVSTQPSQIRLRGRKTCSRECSAELAWRRAEERRKKSPPSRGALNRQIRYSAKMDAWRVAVFKRDNYTCQMCGKRGGYLEADHIKPFALYPKLRFDVDNGRTLCRPCHMTTDTWGRRPEYFEEKPNTVRA